MSEWVLCPTCAGRLIWLLPYSRTPRFDLFYCATCNVRWKREVSR